jgi:hypothetical protein
MRHVACSVLFLEEDAMSDLTNEILLDIRNELRGTNQRLDRTNERLDRVVHEQIRHSTAIVGLEAGFHRVEERLDVVVEAIHGLNTRIDNVLIGGMGEKVREHESRIQRVEEHLHLAPLVK